VKLKLNLSLPKLVKVRVGLQLGVAVGARVDVRVRVRGKEPLRWKAALAPERAAKVPAKLPEPAEAAAPSVAMGRETPRA
jgi:hypothetical protein